MGRWQDHHMSQSTTPTAPPPAALYLRDDCSLLLARGDSAVEVRMTPAQLMALATDAFRVAVMNEPALVTEAMAAMSGAVALETEAPTCPAH
jgi:hypothetical protein